MLPPRLHELLAPARRILLAGCGGGYDVLGAVPLAASLLDAGREVHLASLSFSYLNALEGARQEPSVPNLYAVPGAAATRGAYCPEAWLARFLEERLGYREPVWAFDKTGEVPLHAAYRHLAARLALDAIVIVDGGIDALLRGDESELGTPAEDLTSLAAVHGLESIPRKALVCFALGAELRDGICHEQVFARIAELTRLGGFLGASALTSGTRAGELYRGAVEHCFANQEGQRQSHVNRVVLAALSGEYGETAPHVWLSPLLPLFWCFELGAVASSNLLLEAIVGTQSIWEVSARIEAARRQLALKERSRIPI
ncbi:MAG: DUF1152 domain-containing protein [Acidobacteriota bacterium]